MIIIYIMQVILVFNDYLEWMVLKFSVYCGKNTFGWLSTKQLSYASLTINVIHNFT